MMLSGDEWSAVLFVALIVVMLAVVAWVVFAAVRAGVRHGQRPTALPRGSAAGWFPDPFGRHDARWWDGSAWSEHVSTGGVQTVDPV